MRIDVVSLFPEMFAGPFDASIIARARESGALEVCVHNPREYTEDKHHIVDDYAYGGGPGMVMKPEPLFACVEAVQGMAEPRGRVVLLTPQGRLLTHGVVAELAASPRLILICGHYEGVDERVREGLCDDEISVGDYVLSGGEPAAIVVVDAVARHQPGVLGSELSLEEESHAQGLLEYPQYTRPAVFRDMVVPEILLSGHHAEIAKWRRRQSIIRTARRRPELLAKAELTQEEQREAADLIQRRDAEGTQTSSMQAQLFRVILPVGDIDAAAEFYGAILEQPGERVSGGRHYFDCGGVILACVDPAAAADEFRPNPDHVYFSVEGLEDKLERVRAAGPSWLDEEIAVRPWGERSFYARDPWGNPICFVEAGTEFTGGRFVP